MQDLAEKGLYYRTKRKSTMKKQILLFAGIILLATACSMGGVYYDSYISGNAKESATGEIVAPPQGGDSFEEIKENQFVKVADEPLSSFSVDADGAAYAYMRMCIGRSMLPPKNSVRIEEYLNYFTFDYADPSASSGEMLAINAEAGPCPWNPAHKLLRLGLKGKSLSEDQIPDANFIFLVDVSGSMYGPDRIDLVKSGLINMVDYMRPQDRIAIITYSGHVEKTLESTLVGKGADDIKSAIKKLQASGSTAGGEAMKMAYDEAMAHYSENANNRIIMCTDGDFNVGVSSTDALVEMVEGYQKKGIYLSIMGFGSGNFQDSRMESLSNHGNGTYTYIDCEDEMMKVFVTERSNFYSVANDTKCQVRFNPEVVESYRLIGYENRVMSSEEFEDSNKDAGEIGAGQTVTALYEIVPVQDAPAASPATFETRYKLSLKDADSRSLVLEVPAASEKGSLNLDFAAGVAAYGMCLMESEFKGEASLSMAKELVMGAAGQDSFRKQLVGLIEKAAGLESR